MPSAQCHLDVVYRPSAQLAVVLRRGPSKQVEQVLWHLQGDHFERGQWLKGRVYAERCDLSFDGTALVYFAGKFATQARTWTAVSRPPYFTALAFWPVGDTWYGGGLFRSPRVLELNVPSLRPEHGGLPPRWSMSPLQGQGTIEERRLLRDGWSLETKGQQHQELQLKRLTWRMEPARVFSKPSPQEPNRRLRRHLVRMFEPNGPPQVLEFSLEGRPLGRLDWADWDPNGDLLFAGGGAVFRLPRQRLDQGTVAAKQLEDFSQDRFQHVACPEKYSRWQSQY